MELSNEFHNLVSKLVHQKQDELSREQSQRRNKVLEDSSSKGWALPSGHVYGGFDNLQVESIQRRSEIVWSALEQTLEAFDLSFYPELTTQLYSLAESFFPLSLCEPHDYLSGSGWERPFAERANQQLRSQLEITRHSSLNAVKTKIDLYVARKRSKNTPSKNCMTKKILVLAANPDKTSLLRLDEEIREINNGLERAQQRDKFAIKQTLAARLVDVRRAMLDYRPSIVHFCGHGSEEKGLAFEDQNGQTKFISTDALTEFFALFADQLECIVLNACYSEAQAEAIGKHIPYVIGMKNEIGDDAAIEFAVAFYDALGTGETVEFAYSLACNAIKLAGWPESSTPVLKKRSE